MGVSWHSSRRVRTFENLEAGIEISEFVDSFPGRTLELAHTILDHSAKRLTSSQGQVCQASTHTTARAGRSVFHNSSRG